MRALRWTTVWTMALLAFPVTTALAQRNAPMMVVIRLNDGFDPSLYAPRMAAATGMQLVGVSTSTNSAVFTVPNETDKALGTVAGRNQKTVIDGFPGAVMSYNFGVNYPAPQDLMAPQVVQTPSVDNRRGGIEARRGTIRFTERDRTALRNWYLGRRDTWSQLREGMVLDANQRALAYAVPPELARDLTPVSRAYQYLLVGDNLVLVDSRYTVVDVIRFGDVDDRRGRFR